MFDACYYINRDRSPDRNAAFQRRWRSVKDWPFPEPVRVPGTDPPPPEQWKSGIGAFGAMTTHFTICANALYRGLNSIIIFEDDVVFCDGFSEKLHTFMGQVPNDWEQIYLGGNHHYKPWRVKENVVKCTGACGMWACAFRGQGLAKPFTTLARFPNAIADENCHCDTLWCTLHRWRQVKAYGPDHWLCGHAAGASERVNYVWDQDEYFQLTDAALAALPLET
jgi:hypothetical protein